jgi:hypothetical protein
MFSCPTCGESLEPVELQQPAGLVVAAIARNAKSVSAFPSYTAN